MPLETGSRPGLICKRSLIRLYLSRDLCSRSNKMADSLKWSIKEGYLYINGRRMLSPKNRDLPKIKELKPGRHASEIWVYLFNYNISNRWHLRSEMKTWKPWKVDWNAIDFCEGLSEINMLSPMVDQREIHICGSNLYVQRKASHLSVPSLRTLVFTFWTLI